LVGGGGGGGFVTLVGCCRKKGVGKEEGKEEEIVRVRGRENNKVTPPMRLVNDQVAITTV
jgi:hypothetical protein